MKKYFFGCKVHEACNDIKSVINNHLNKLYIEPHKLKSGRNETAMFQEVRKELWPGHCRKKAKDSVKGRMKPTGKNGIASIIITNEKSQADWEEEKYVQLMSRMDRKWFPKEWLAYIMVGKPAMWMILVIYNYHPSQRGIRLFAFT